MMFIENWLAAVTFAGLFLLMLIPCAGWYVEGMRLEKAERQNKKLLQEKGDLRLENMRLKYLVEFYKNANEDGKSE